MNVYVLSDQHGHHIPSSSHSTTVLAKRRRHVIVTETDVSMLYVRELCSGVGIYDASEINSVYQVFALIVAWVDQYPEFNQVKNLQVNFYVLCLEEAGMLGHEVTGELYANLGGYWWVNSRG